MDIPTMIAVVPLVAMVIGGLAGLYFGYSLRARPALWLLGAVALASVALLARMAVIAPGEEMKAFAPFVTLTGGLFPALFGGILGWVGGRALRRRSGRD